MVQVVWEMRARDVEEVVGEKYMTGSPRGGGGIRRGGSLRSPNVESGVLM